jgi:hypothetical protein
MVYIKLKVFEYIDGASGDILSVSYDGSIDDAIKSIPELVFYKTNKRPYKYILKGIRTI